MQPESDENRKWRAEFEAMSPVQKRMAVTHNPNQFAPSPRLVFWQALLAEDDSARRDAREEETLAIAKEANRLASEANDIARSQTAAAWRAARYGMYAAAIAAAAALASYKDQVLALFTGAPR
jgi:hypothetical protein